MNSGWIYKNFNMVSELDIAGEFIYNGVHELNRLKSFSTDGPTFSTLYNISVGIERLQKIVYVLFGMDAMEDKESFEKELITHSHTGLRDKINDVLKKNGIDVRFTARENGFLELLNNFYRTARYNRFNVDGSQNKEILLIKGYINSHYNRALSGIVNQEDYVPLTDDIKEFFGRIIGGITLKYYKLVRNGSERNCTYTYELRVGSKAEKIFLGEHRHKSLIDEQQNERISLKELFIFFRNTTEKNGFLNYVDDIKPLGFDAELLAGYFESIINGIIPQGLIDDVETMYAEEGYSKDRIQLVDLFADSGVYYEYPLIKKAYELILFFIENEDIPAEDEMTIKEISHIIKEDEVLEVIKKVINAIEAYKRVEVTKEEMRTLMEESVREFRGFLLREIDG